jgi:acetyl-CoA C-acetyltransferase
MPQPVYVIGAGRTDFTRNFRKEGKSIRDMIVEAGRAAIADAGIEPKDVQAAVVGNFASGLFTRQLHLGAYVTDIDEALVGIPTLHVEAACASGGVAVLTAAQQIMGGLHDVVLVIGAEQQKTMSPADGADVLGAAADYRAEKAVFGEFKFPKLFARIAELYMQRYGLTEQDLARVALKNHAHARLNSLAQMRDSTLSFEQACCASDANPRIAPPLKVTDCSQITDGAAAAVLSSMSSKPARSSVRLLGWGHTTDHLPLDRKRVPEFPLARRAARQAYDMARLTPADIHAADVHDCFSISEGRQGRGSPARRRDDAAAAARRPRPVTQHPGQPRGRVDRRRASGRRDRRAAGRRSFRAAHRQGRCATGRERTTIPHLQHGRQRHQQRRDDLEQ